MSALIYLTNQTFGMLTVASRATKTPSGNQRWNCRCECGNETAVHGAHLRSGHTTSCGCYASTITTNRNTTHGLRKSPEYSVWAAMIGRCSRPSDKAYKNYGGRGITVDESWKDFSQFYADVGPRPGPNYELDRADNDGNYNKDNARWVTKAVNLRNLRKTVMLTYKGTAMCQKDASVASGISEKVLIRRRAEGLTTEAELFAPTPKRGKR